jgi:hypothetical protein
MPLRPLNRLKTSGLFVFWNKIVHLFQPLALGCTLARPSHGRSGRGLLRNWVRQRPTTRLRQLWGILRNNQLQEISNVLCWRASAFAALRVFEFARALPPISNPGIRAEVRASAPPLFSRPPCNFVPTIASLEQGCVALDMPAPCASLAKIYKETH